MPLDLFTERRSLRPLRPYQQSAIEGLRRSRAAGHLRQIVMLPTGAGKTLLAAHIISLTLSRGQRVAFTVPALSLIDQTVAAFAGAGLFDEVGVMQGQHPRTDSTAPIQICSAQTLARRARPEVDLVIVDEAHLAHQSIFDWMADRPELRFIGLSATPWTRGLGKHYSDLVIGARTGDLIDAGYLSKFVVYAPSEIDLSGVGTMAGDFNEAQLAKAVDQPRLVGDIIDTWARLGNGLPTICYGVDRAHALHVHQRFEEAGVPSSYIDAFTEREERERIFDRFRRGEIRVICNVATLTTGIDLDVRCLIDARPTRSEMRFVQTIGRGLRTAPGKDRLIILDHAGNHLRLGMVTDIFHNHLDGGELRKGANESGEREPVLPRKCEACAALMPRGALKCEECGAVREAKSGIISAEGELTEIGTAPARLLSPTVIEQAAFFGELKGHAAEKGYAAGWAKHKFREKYGIWPDAPILVLAQPAPPSLKTRNWIRSRQIAYAKARMQGAGA